MLLALTALLCLFAQLSAIAHTDFAAHGVCEHGELTDLSDASGSAQSVQIVPRRHARAGLSTQRDGAATSLQGLDDHCALAQLLRQVNAAHAPALLMRSWVAARIAAPLAREVYVSRRPLDVSPKQSPPV